MNIVLKASNDQSVLQLCADSHIPCMQCDLHLVAIAILGFCHHQTDDPITLVLRDLLKQYTRCGKVTETSYTTIELLV